MSILRGGEPILLLLEDGEIAGAGGAENVHLAGGGQIVLARPPGAGGEDDDEATLTLADGTDVLSLGGQFLTAEDLTGATKDAEGNLVTKIELEVVVEKTPLLEGVSPRKKNTAKQSKNVGASLTAADRKVCLWPTGTGATCGKTFTKFDSLKRHLSEAHKGLRPYACTLCEKTYGRRDYLQRHLKSHNASYAVNLAGGNLNDATVASTAQLVKKVQLAASKNAAAAAAAAGAGVSAAASSVTQPIVVQVSNTSNSSGGGTVQIIQGSPTQVELSSPTGRRSSGGGAGSATKKELTSPNPLPFFSISGQLPTAKPMGSKICRWVQNDGTVCGKAFSKLDSLRRHVGELHKGQRPYACNLCEKSYGRRDYLDRHMRTHEKKKRKAEEAAAAAAASAEGGMDWGPNSGVLMAGDEVPPPEPKVVKKKRKDIPPEEKKICLWILEDGTACGKTFTKFDSLKRHVSESHKSIRPYTCTLCGKNYGRRDYLLRHLKSHSEIDISNIAIQKVRNNPSNHPDNLLNSSLGSGGGGGAGSTSTTSGLPNINFGTMVPQPQSNGGLSLSPIKINPVPGASAAALKRKAIEDKKTCKWTLENGSICGRTFSKHDSLRRHIDELHKNIRPFVCEICDKSYGRKDYLDRHLKIHEEKGEGGEDGGVLPPLDEEDENDAIAGLDAADIESMGGAITGHVVDSDDDEDEEGGGGGGTMIVVGGPDDPLGRGVLKRSAAGGMPGVTPLTKTLRIADDEDDAVGGVMGDLETTTTTTVVVEAAGDDDDDGVLPSVVTVVSDDV